MSVDCFLDTNVIVYAAAGRGAESAKRERALEWARATPLYLEQCVATA